MRIRHSVTRFFGIIVIPAVSTAAILYFGYYLIWGTRDRLLPEGTLPFFRRALPSAEVTTLPNCGHLPHLEQPQLFAEAVLSFLDA